MAVLMNSMASTPLAALPPGHPHASQWEIFCRVIDNLGDIGVCWRLCRNLVLRGQRVRLWIDVPDDLQWMAPGAMEGAFEGIEVVHWVDPMPATHPAVADCVDSEVWIEAFGCDPPPACINELAIHLSAGGAAPRWLNLEYMSAEAYVERCHRLPSPIMSGPLVGLTKHFFYPGFTPATGGLLREPDLMERRCAFDPRSWLQDRIVAESISGEQQRQAGSRRVSLFCYSPRALTEVLDQASQSDQMVDWFITPGWAQRSTDEYLANRTGVGSSMRLHSLAYVTQPEFDQMLWSCDLNFVRGEDSLVRALWAGKPFVWHIYPQDDLAHHAKLDAFLDWLEAPASLRAFHRQWNAVDDQPVRWPDWGEIDSWQAVVIKARDRLLSQCDLVSQLMAFVA